MKASSFDKIARELFGNVLHPFWFSCTQSQASVFYREVAKDILHIVLPDLGTRGEWYDVKVYPFWKHFDPLFGRHFPDEL